MMNESPWNDNDAAFGPMFSEVAVFTLDSSELSGNVKCCAFPKEDIDPFADSDNISDIKSVTLLVKKSDWNFTNRAKPNVGDKFTLSNGEKYKIYTATPEQSWWNIIGRSYS